MLSTLRPTLLYLLLVYIRETLSHESTDSSNAFKSSAFNYSGRDGRDARDGKDGKDGKEALIYPLAEQMAKEKVLYYSNDTGITLHCPLPDPYALKINSLFGRVAERIAELLEPLANGSLVIKPFPSSAYRQDIHSITTYCVAKNSIGTEMSELQRVRAAISQYYEISVFDEYVIRGCTAVLKCHIPEYIKPYVSVISWIKNSAYEIVGHGEKYSVFPSGELHIRDSTETDHHSYTGYRCKIRNLVNNQTKLSSQGSIIVSDPSNSITPRIIDCRSIIVVEEGSDFVELPCAAQAKPAPTYSWHKVVKTDGTSHPLTSHQRYEYRSGSLIMRNVRLIDANKYICVATNSIGEAKCETEVKTFAKLNVNIEPKKLVVEVGERVEINCSLYGHPVSKTIWLHNGLAISPDQPSYNMEFLSGQSILVINAVANSDQGIWQCLALNSGGDSAIDSTQLILDGLPPHFIAQFDDQSVRINDKISLKCVGTGHPIPMITWFLDGSELDIRKQEAYTLHKALWDEYIVDRNIIVSYLNITISSQFDGGSYECVVKNKAGMSRHSAQIRVSGPTKIRPMPNRNFTAINDIALTCPVVGDQPKLIEWHKDDKKLPLNHRHRVHGNGTLEISHLDKSDSGIYTCIAFGEKNTDVVKQSFLMRVKVPPVIEGFSFDNKLQAGMRTRIYCNVAQGDQPVSIIFFKDGIPIKGNREDGITVQEVDRFSLSLAIASLSALHNGNYSCIASNEAATVSYSSYLLVNVPPKWIIEPKNSDAVEGNNVRIDCSADGFPIVQITWKRLVDTYNSESNTKGVHQQYLLIRSGPKYQVFQNGTLKISNVDSMDEAQYLCQANNGIGSGLSTLAKLFVHIPAKFKESIDYSNISVHQRHSMELVAHIIGDHPITVEWNFNSHKISSNSEYIIKEELTEKGIISILKVRSVLQNNSGIYKCIAINAYLKSPVVKKFNVIVKEPPEPPQELSIASKSSQTIALLWKRPYNGNDEIKEYIIQYLSTESESFHLKNITVFGNSTTTVLRGLHPSTQYTIVMFAVNSVGKSNPSKELSFVTEEESPSGPPTRVQLTALDATSIKVEWHSPPEHHINGELKGFYIGYKALNTNDPFIYKTVQTKPDLDLGSAFSLILPGLRPYTHYSVIVQAYNSVGAGPRSDEMSVRTIESIPSSAPTGVSCVSFSSQSLSISWNNLPQEHINGILKGYRVYYRPDNNKDVMKNEVTAQQNKLTLYGLQKNTNYSIAINAFNQIGNSLSASINCKTQEDLPSQPEAIKAFQSSPDSVVVSWKAPKEPNGVLRKYTIYRKSANEEEVNSFTVPSHLTHHKTSNLIRAKKYGFWVTAWTEVGEGITSNIVNVIIATKISARIISFSDQIEGTVGENIELFCRSVGTPAPNTEWKVNGRTLESEGMAVNPRIQALMNGSLRISNITFNDSGNYSCIVSNIHGFDSIVYELKIKRDSNSNYPLSPIVELLSVTSSSVTIKWQLRGEELAPIKAHEVYFRSSQNKEWKYYIITDDGVNKNKSFAIEHLQCGNHYQIYVINVNTFGKSSPSDILNVRTLGREPISPPLKTFITRINSTAVKLNLNTWRDGGCPFTSHPIVQWKSIDSNQWNLLFINSVLESAVLNDLKTNKNYKIKVIMKNSAGATAVEYDIESLSPANNVYHISGHSPVQIAVEHFDSTESTDHEVIPVLFTVIISIVLLLAGLLAIYILYRAMQKRFNQNGSGERTGTTNNILRKMAFIQTKNSKRITEPMDAIGAELTSLSCTEDHMRLKAFNKSTESMTTTSFQCKDDTNYKYVSIPKQEIPSDYYSIVQKNRKCNTNAKQALMLEVSQRSPNRYSLPNTMFDKEKHLANVETHDSECCAYLADNQKPVECVCCALFDPECCNTGLNWQPICQFEANSAQMATSFNSRKFNNN